LEQLSIAQKSNRAIKNVCFPSGHNWHMLVYLSKQNLAFTFWISSLTAPPVLSGLCCSLHKHNTHSLIKENPLSETNK
jgi:hypothetical protein